MAISSFKRVEEKYLITEDEKRILLETINKHMILDAYCEGERPYKIENIYFDTKNNDLISNSISKPVFKQKLRARKYDGLDFCYLEIKKKSDGVVGKRRLSLSFKELESWVNNKNIPKRDSYIDKAVIGEIDYILSVYKVEPKVYISYERLGFFDINNKEFRITFDNKIHTKRNNLVFDSTDYELDLLPPNTYIMEIKSVCNFPLWLVRELSRLKIYPKSFSKYGEEYKKYLEGMGLEK
ncbi:MAG: VTC domain-containing protein [Anaeroplasmataceae bacterium]